MLNNDQNGIGKTTGALKILQIIHIGCILQFASPTFPNKKHAILFNSIKNTKLEEILVALENIIQPKYIKFSLRMSSTRIYVYTYQTRIVNSFLSAHNGKIASCFSIKQAQELITPNERLLIYNVCSQITHTITEEELKKLGIILTAPITFLRIGISSPEYKHILSFRRQTNIST